jgi:Leu/Phe-tRNA-protein transferase
VALSFAPDFVAELVYYGFLPMAERTRLAGGEPPTVIMLPKLHRKRCVLQWPDLHVGRTVLRAGRRYRLSVDCEFEAVIAGCHAQHGESWLYPPIVAALRSIFRTQRAGQAPTWHNVRVHTFELWEAAAGGGEDVLVAGEVGTAVGGSYLALSGFRRAGTKGAGSVQCCATARLLQVRTPCSPPQLGGLYLIYEVY